MKAKVRFIDIIHFFAIIGADLIVYMVFGLLLMGYADNWDSSKGAYLSWSSMNANEKLIYVCYLIWNFINVLGVFYIIRKIYRMKLVRNGL
mgnify:CR=1 FL=1